MTNLMRLHHAAQTIEAWNDWTRLSQSARQSGHEDLVKKFAPKPGAGWRTVDRQYNRLAEALKKMEVKP